jgi:hypothetical protein
VPCSDLGESAQNTTALSLTRPNPYQLLVPPSPSPEHLASSSRTENMKNWGSTGWSALKPTLKIVEKVSSAFPPLSMAVGGLLAVIEHIDVRIVFQMTNQNIF